MGEPKFLHLAVLVLFSSLMLVAGLYLLAKFNSIFRGIKIELLRLNLAVWLISICIFLALTPTQPEFYKATSPYMLFRYFVHLVIGTTIEALIIFNLAWLVDRSLRRFSISFRKKMTIILLTIIAACMLGGVLNNYFGNGGKLLEVRYTILYSFYTGCMAGLIYITMNYVNLERKRKLNEKELEVSRLQALKTKAELDALHSKINPHFLYNALNSIADLSITDGKKARKMTVALADLFRYSINYSDHNYSTVKEELEMTEVYLQIEKIRFEDQLIYTIHADEEAGEFLVPRFILQPLVENAVKHGLKATGKMTEIELEIKKLTDSIVLHIADNGPGFPDELVPGYGVRSVYDKLDLLFKDSYEIHFSNLPRKRVSIYIQKLMKNEPAV